MKVIKARTLIIFVIIVKLEFRLCFLAFLKSYYVNKERRNRYSSLVRQLEFALFVKNTFKAIMHIIDFV